jgi:Kef-type K+ transport system membrane component KefB
MAVDHSVPELDRRGLRRFGLVTGAIVAALFGLVLPWLLGRAMPVWPWVVFAGLSIWALIAAASLRMVYRSWMRLALLLNKVTTPVIMGVIFLLLIVPIAMIMRTAGRDRLRREFDESVDSYRIESARPSKEFLRRPF